MKNDTWTPAKILFAVTVWGSGLVLIASELFKSHG